MGKRRISFKDSPLGQFYLWYTQLGDEPVDRVWVRWICVLLIVGVAALVLLGWP